MTHEIPDADDSITAAIEGVAATMGGAAHEYLLGEGVFKQAQGGREQILGCIACQLQREPGAYGGQITSCTGRDNSSIAPVLRAMEKGGALKSWKEEGDARELKRPLRRYYVLADTEVGRNLASRLTPPETCYRERPLPEAPGIPAETYLMSLSDTEFGHRSPERQRALGCLACLFHRQGSEVYSKQISDCTQKHPNRAAVLLQTLERVGIVISRTEEGYPKGLGHPPRKYYSLADTPIGQQFAELLAAPPECGLDTDR